MKQVLLFFGLLIGLSLPFWLMGIFWSEQKLLFGLPISALMAACPLLAAMGLTYYYERWRGVKKLLVKTFDFNKIRNKFWLLLAVLIMPLAMLASWYVIQLCDWPQPSIITFAWASLPLMLIFYFVGAIGEELGWMGYAIDRLQEKFGFLKAAIGLGLVWELWHVVPFLAQGRGWAWIGAQCLAGIAMRIIIVWLYNNANQSVFVAIIFHTFINVSFSLFPNAGSYYNPFAVAVVLIAISMGLILWRPGFTSTSVMSIS